VAEAAKQEVMTVTGMVWFALGTIVGGWFGVLLMAMLFIAKDTDKYLTEDEDAQPNETH
jgi:hypothetical protein